MNLHINVIRGCCVLGYFQQRGWEDVKHAKPLCIYANWLHFSIWIPTLLKWTCLPVLCLFFLLNQGPKWVCVGFFLSRPPGWTAACLHISSVRCGINGLWMLSASDSRWFCSLILCSCDTANILVRLAARLAGEHGIPHRYANIRFRSICQRG